MEMKASGMYVSRGLSFQEAEFETVETSLTEEQVKMYDMTTHVWWVALSHIKMCIFFEACNFYNFMKTDICCYHKYAGKIRFQECWRYLFLDIR